MNDAHEQPGSAANIVGRVGTVTAYDEHRGLGELETPDGRRLAFHATQIAGRRRRIDAGTQVSFVLRPGPGGRYEAGAVTPLSLA